jgi:hypothetical protein
VTPGVNLKAAKAIGLTIPDSFVLLADDRMSESGQSRLERDQQQLSPCRLCP